MRLPLCLVASLVLGAPVSAQSPGTAHGEIVETSTGPYSVGDTYEVTVRLRADPGDLGVGTSSIVVDFESAFATFAASPVEGEADDYAFSRYQGGQTSHSGGFAGYTSDVVRTNPDRLTVTIDLGFTSDGNGQALPSAFVDVVAVRFTVADPTVAPALLFETVQLYTGPGDRYVNGTFSGVGGPGIDVVLDGPQGWYQLAAPVEGATVGGFLGALWTQGFDGADAPSGDPTVYVYDEDAVCDADEGTPDPPCDADTGYAPPASASASVAPGTGLFVYAYADDDPMAPGEQGGFPKTLTLSGTEPSLPFSFPGLTYTDTGSAVDDGWTLLGNPVQDSLDWDAPGWTKTDVSNAIYVYDPGAGEYLTWNGTAGTLAGGLVPPARGFWAQATGPSPALEAPAAARVSGDAASDAPAEGAAARESGEGPAAVAVVELRATGPSAVGERGASVFVAFGIDGAVVGADAFDALALVPPAAAYVLAGARRDDGALLAIDARPHLSETVESDGPIEITLSVDAVGLEGDALTLRWPRTLPAEAGWTSTLVDWVEGVEVDLASEEAYTFIVGGSASRGSRAPSTPSATPARPRLSAPPLLVAAAPHGAARRGMGDRFLLRFARASAVVSQDVPSVFAVHTPVPNPAARGVRFAVDLPEAADVSVAVFDILGRRVVSAEREGRPAGRHDLGFDAGALAAGVYVVRTRLEPGTGDPLVVTHKLTVVR